MDRKHRELMMRIFLGLLLTASLGALASCGGGGGGSSSGGATTPGAFVLSAPSGTSVVPTPTLSWTAASGATIYSVEVSTSQVFSTLTTTASAAAPTTSIVVSGLSPSTTYYWRVTATNSVGSTAATPASLQFTTKKSGEVAWSKASEPSAFFNTAFGMKIDGENIYLAGYDTAVGDGQFEWRMEKRSLSDGSPVTTFGTSGTVVSNPTPTWTDTAYAVAIDSNYMYVAGYDSLPGETDQEWRIEKRDLVTGALITAFNGSGHVSENNSAGADDRLYAIAVDSSPTGTIYAVGYETPSTVNEWRIEARSKVSGALVSSSTSSLGSMDSVANAIAIDVAEGFMYVVGSDGSGFDTKWRIEKRSLSAPLSLETTTFGVATGIVTSNPSTGIDEAMAVALDANYMYIVGSERDVANSRFMWRIEKRDRSTGALETGTFGSSNGWVNSNTTTNARATAIAIDATHMYVAGYDNTGLGSLEWRIEKRDLATGALDATFGTGGVVINSYSNASAGWDDDIWTISADASYIYVAGSEAWPNTSGSRWRIEKIVK